MQRLSRTLFRGLQGFYMPARFFSYRERVSDEFIEKLASKAQGKETIKKEKPTRTERSTSTNSEAKEKKTKTKVESEVVKTDINPPKNDGYTIEDPEVETKEREKQKKRLQEGQEITFQPVKVLSIPNKIIDTQYGPLKLPNKFNPESLSNIYYLVNASNINYIKSCLHNDIKSLFLFPPVDP